MIRSAASTTLEEAAAGSGVTLRAARRALAETIARGVCHQTARAAAKLGVDARTVAVAHSKAPPPLTRVVELDRSPTVRVSAGGVAGWGARTSLEARRVARRHLARAAVSENAAVRREVADRADCPQAIVVALASDQDAYVRSSAALHPAASLAEINLFAGDPDWRARWGAAANPRCPPELLERLASDMSPNVCAAVASNPASSPELLQQLRTETQWPVPVSLAGNPNTATEILAELADRDTITQSAVASNPSTDRDTLWHLARSHDIDVRRGVALNPLCPPDILQKLVSDNDYRVVETAGAHPSYDGPIPYSPRYDEP